MIRHSDQQFLSSFGQAVYELMDQNDLGIPQVCKRLNMSRSQVHRRIKVTTGVSTSIYIRNLKLEKARKLLLNSDMNIAAVAHVCGINNPQNMSKYFSNVYGMSPSEYRLQSK